jgi:hypothetical protein
MRAKLQMASVDQRPRYNVGAAHLSGHGLNVGAGKGTKVFPFFSSEKNIL